MDWLEVHRRAQPYLHPVHKVMSNIKSESLGYSCDNYHLFTAHFFNLRRVRNETPHPNDIGAYAQFLAGCMNFGIPARFPGRTWKGQDISHDEIMAIAWMRWGCPKAEWAFDPLEWGRNHSWCYNLQEPSKFAWRFWYYRQLDFVPFLKACAGEKLSKFDQVTWAVQVNLNAKDARENTSGKLLRYLQFSVMEGKGCLVDRAIADWKESIKHMYPRGVKEIFEIYFGVEHPLAAAFPEGIV